MFDQYSTTLNRSSTAAENNSMGNGASSNSGPVSVSHDPIPHQSVNYDENQSSNSPVKNMPKSTPQKTTQKGPTSEKMASSQSAHKNAISQSTHKNVTSQSTHKNVTSESTHKSVTSPQKKTDFHEVEIEPADEKVKDIMKSNEKAGSSAQSQATSLSSGLQSKSADKETAHGSKKQRNKLYFPTEDDLVFETFYHQDGRECECMYMNGQRFYLDSWNSKEWQIFPMKWYDEGMLVTNTIINDKEQEPIAIDQASKNKEKKDQSNTEMSQRTNDDREGWINHPKRGKIPTYIFEERHNVHCFFDVYSGMWLRLPLGWELIHETVKKMVETVEAAIPTWKDRYEIVAMLRACNYNPDECISNYLQIEGDDLKGVRNAGDAKALQAKDQQVTDMQKKLKEMERKLNEAIKSKNEASTLASELQTRLSSGEAELNTARVQLDSLQQTRPKTARPKTPQLTVVSKVTDDDLDALMRNAKGVNEAYIQLKMDVERWMGDVGKTVIKAVTGMVQLKDAQSDQLKQLEELRGLYRREALQRRILYNQLQDVRGNIRVFVRCRKDKNVPCCMKFLSDQDIDIQGTSGGRKLFQFDKVFDLNSNQEKVFEDTQPIITCCLDGYNVCIMAYGQTGSGKTYTMMGPQDNHGVNTRSIKELLRIREERIDTIAYVIKVSIIEIYNETVHDLLTKDAGTLEVRAQGNHVTIPGLAEMEVATFDDIQQVMEMGDKNRSVASTKMNSSSSRSHLVMMVCVTGTNRVTGAQTLGKLMLCDLAGSERISKSEAEGQRLVEAAAINKSLSALGQVFSALRSKQLHIPYRNSKLTHILQPSLGGEAKACLFVNVSPDAYNLTETLSSLQFGANARQIQLGQAKKNVVKPGKVDNT